MALRENNSRHIRGGKPNKLENLSFTIIYFFFIVRDSTPGPYIYYVLSLPTELRSRGLSYIF